jgi:hypothetical protein
MLNEIKRLRNKFNLYFIVLGLGLIILIESWLLIIGDATQEKTDLIQSSERCSTLNQFSSKLQCWEDLIDSALNEKNGLDKSFDIIANLYNKDPEFTSNCHSFVHKLGDKAYFLYSGNQSFQLSNNSSTCGYGFYHGFMETLLTKGVNIKQAGNFCEWAGKQVKGNNDIQGACFHGIGHGLSENHDIKFWPSEDALVAKSLNTCIQVAPDEQMINRCASGVFNVMAIKYTSNQVPLNKHDPLRYCKSQTKPYFKKPCFEEMNTMLISLAKNDFIVAAKFLEGVEDEYAISAMRSLAGVMGNYDLVDQSTQISNCRSLPDRLRIPCIRGFVAGLIEGGIPNGQDTIAINFCNQSNLKDDERKGCYQETLWLLSVYIPKDKYKQVCRNVNESYQKFCSST